jgi:hypothetical protein
MNNYTFKRTKHKNWEIYEAFKDGKKLYIKIQKTEKGYRHVSVNTYSLMGLTNFFDTLEECAIFTRTRKDNFIKNNVIIIQ